MLKQSDLLHVATLGKSVGLKGDMKLHIKSDFPEQFKKDSTFYLNPQTTITIEEVNHKRGLVKLKGCDTPELAKKYTNAKLYTTIEQTKKDCKLEEGQFFWFDIVGCEAYEDDMLLGKIVEIERILDNDYLKIKTADSLVEKKLPKTFLVPYLDNFILKVDIDSKKIKLNGAYDILEAS